MKNVVSVLALTGVLTGVLTGAGLYAQAHHEPTAAQAGSSAQQQAAPGRMPDACKAMVANRKQMMADMKSMDSALDEKVTAMNNATGSAKVDAMAEVINELVSQRKQMQQKMMSMNGSMMGMMMGGYGAAMMNCPMMQTTPGAAPSK